MKYPTILQPEFYAQDTVSVAQKLVGKVISHRIGNIWLRARIIETESYLITEKASHSSLGKSHSNRATFMEPGTIYMYYSRGKDSMNISTGEIGDAVLLKSGFPYVNRILSKKDQEMIKLMQKLNPINGRPRPLESLCAGQTLLCSSLGIKLTEWNTRQFDPDRFYIEDVGYTPQSLIHAKRLGIPENRDEGLKYRYVDLKYAKYCTSNPIKRTTEEGKDYIVCEK